MDGPKTVLLVDDSKTIRAVLQLYLMGLGAEFLEASDGTEALEVVGSRPVDLIIADVRMAPMDGLALLHALRGDLSERVRRLPVILLTGDRDADLERRGRAEGANAVIHKPISAKELRATLDGLARAA